MRVELHYGPRDDFKPVDRDTAAGLAAMLLAAGLDDVRAAIAIGAVSKGEAWTTRALLNVQAKALVDLLESGQLPDLDSPRWLSEVDQRISFGNHVPAHVLAWRSAA